MAHMIGFYMADYIDTFRLGLHYHSWETACTGPSDHEYNKWPDLFEQTCSTMFLLRRFLRGGRISPTGSEIK